MENVMDGIIAHWFATAATDGDEEAHMGFLPLYFKD
jgi:hypothetical protein